MTKDNTWIVDDFNEGTDSCEHGGLKRKCERCEAAGEIARLRAENVKLNFELHNAVVALLESCGRPGARAAAPKSVLYDEIIPHIESIHAENKRLKKRGIEDMQHEIGELRAENERARDSRGRYDSKSEFMRWLKAQFPTYNEQMKDAARKAWCAAVKAEREAWLKALKEGE